MGEDGEILFMPVDTLNRHSNKHDRLGDGESDTTGSRFGGEPQLNQVSDGVALLGHQLSFLSRLL